MRKLCNMAIGALALAASNFAASETGSWSVNPTAPIAYAPQEENSNFVFAPVATPRNATITKVEFDLGLYANGANPQTFRICHGETPPSFPKCLPFSTTRNSQTDFFNGLNARVYFKITGFLYGGTYPVYPKHNNWLKVTYQY
jgi:hypothetical protein